MLQFVVADYMATGEGMTIMILITMAYPKNDDYEEDDKSHMNEDGSFHFEMPNLKEGVTPRVIAFREFAELFGGYMASGAQIITKEEFKEKWSKYVPAHVNKIIDDTDMGNFKYYSCYHVNFS